MNMLIGLLLLTLIGLNYLQSSRKLKKILSLQEKFKQAKKSGNPEEMEQVIEECETFIGK